MFNSKHKGLYLRFNILYILQHSTGRKELIYNFIGYVWNHTGYSIFVMTASQELIKGEIV